MQNNTRLKIASGILAWLMIALPALSQGGGTLPLRLPSAPGGGTLPLRLGGDSHRPLPPGVLPTELNLTRAIQAPAPVDSSIVCTQSGANVSKHVASGSVKIGDATYAVGGICYNHSTKQMEIVSAANNVSLIGELVEETPSNFAGRMTLRAGDQRLSFQLRRIVAQGGTDPTTQPSYGADAEQ
jgi:hypothetical protein